MSLDIRNKYEWSRDEILSECTETEWRCSDVDVAVYKSTEECKTYTGVEFTRHDYYVQLGQERSGILWARISMDAPVFVDDKAEYKKILRDIAVSLGHVLPFVENEYRKRAPYYDFYYTEEGEVYVDRAEEDGVVVMDNGDCFFKVLVRQGTDLLWDIIEVHADDIGEGCYGRNDAMGVAMLIRDMLKLRYGDIAELFAEAE